MSDDQILFKLNDYPEQLILKDMNYQFAYTRAMKPDGKPSNFYTMCYKENGQPDWFIVNGLLSEEFTACKTEAVIKHINESLGGNLVGESHWRDKTSVKSTFMLKGYELDFGEPENVDLLIFKLVTGVDIQEINQRTGLAFHIINGFSGNLALNLNFGFITASFGTIEGSDKPTRLTVSNIFVLDEFTHRLIHGGKLSIEYAEVQDVKTQCEQKIAEFKEIKLDAVFMESLTKCFPKKFVKHFLSVFDNIPEEYQNMYYATYIFSAILEQARNINQEINLRKYISAYVAKQKLIKDKNTDV